MIVKHLEDGSFVPLIDKKFNINEIQDAFDYVESGQKVGNVLIEVKNS
jgi:NADPH:quinone reductase-like Zn-dependent oxidoreductase